MLLFLVLLIYKVHFDATPQTLQIWIKFFFFLIVILILSVVLDNFRIILQGVCLCPSDLSPFEMNISQQLSSLQIDQLWHLLMQDQVFKGPTPMCRAED